MKITVIGTGYVGLVTGSVFSTMGHHVVCVDSNESKIEALRQGVLPIYEPGLDVVVAEGVAYGCLSFSTDTVDAVRDSDIVFLAVGTPQNADGSANLTYLESATKSIAHYLKPSATVVVKSTVPVGTNQRVGDILRSITGRPIDVASNPEFLKEGTAVDDCLKPDRIVLGVRRKEVGIKLQQLYAPLTASLSPACPVLLMDPESAEMTKYVANCFLAMKISFINEMSNLCNEMGADIEDIRKGICSDQRIGWEFLNPGVGYGGSCFPKDIRALIDQANSAGADCGLLERIDEVNERQKQVMPQAVVDHFDQDVRGRRIAVWGLAFKPGTDDIRESPSLALIEQLLAQGAQVTVHDPEAMENVRAVFGDSILYFDDKFDAAWSADALVVMTDWSEYRELDPSEIRWRLTPRGSIFDGRNCLNRKWFARANIDFYSMGQKPLRFASESTRLPATLTIPSSTANAIVG